MEEKSRILKKLNDDRSRPVSFNDSFGGSENQMRLLLKNLPDESFKDINLILNNSDYDLLEKDRINVLWVQHFVNQKEEFASVIEPNNADVSKLFITLEEFIAK